MGAATEQNLYKNIGDSEVCTDFKMLQVKYLSFFSARRDGRYLGSLAISFMVLILTCSIAYVRSHGAKLARFTFGKLFVHEGEVISSIVAYRWGNFTKIILCSAKLIIVFIT